MREILFRGKTESGDWAYGYYVFTPRRTGTFGQTISQADFDRHYILTMKYNFAKEINPETVGQYTGLTDKNGNKIFEGDIVKFGDISGIINYSFGCYCVKTNKPDWKSRNNPAIDIVFNEYPNEIEIIGNIQDNPELLKGEINA